MHVHADVPRALNNTNFLAPCALSNTVIGTAISSGYAQPLHTLALSATRVGFPCIVVQPIYPGWPWAHPTLVANLSLFRAVPDPARPFLPREERCRNNHSGYGWRRVHPYKMKMWMFVLNAGFNLLGMDSDWVLIANPLPRLLTSHQLLLSSKANNSYERVAMDDHAADFVAVLHDGYGRRQLNIGLVFVRSTPITIMLARTAFNRSFAAQDQPIINEELNAGQLTGHRRVSCCFSFIKAVPEAYKQPLSSGCEAFRPFFKQDIQAHTQKWTDAQPAIVEEHTCAPDADIPPASGRPKGSKQTWSNGWLRSADNKRVGSTAYGPCTRLDNVCGCPTARTRVARSVGLGTGR